MTFRYSERTEGGVRRVEADGGGPHEWTEGGAVRLEWADVEVPSIALVEAVAAVTGRNVLELPPLNDALDGDALEALLESDADELVITFRYADTTVVVEAGETIAVRPDS